MATSSGKKNCKSGYPCKAACISRERNCKNALEGQGKTYAEFLKIQLAKESGSGSEPKQEDAPKAKGLIQGTRSEYAQSFADSWDGAPDDLAKVLETIDDPVKIENPKTNTSHYLNGGIHMNPEDDNRKDMIWRHEFGHLIDEQAGNILGANKLDEAARKAGLENFDDIRTLAASDAPAAQKALQEIKREIGVDPSKPLKKSELIKEAAGIDSGEFRMGLASASKDYRDASDKDSETILNKSNASDEVFRKVLNDKDAVELFKQHKDSPELKALTKDRPISDEKKALIGKVVEGIRLNRDVEIRATQLALQKYKGEVPPKTQEDRSKLLKAIGDERFNAQVEMLGDKSSVAVELFKRSGQAANKAMFASLSRTPDDPKLLMTLGEKAFDSGGAITDLAGAVTLNRVGSGHSNEYYAKNKNARFAESFANITALHGVSKKDPLAARFLESLTPNSYNSYRSILNQVVEARTQ